MELEVKEYLVSGSLYAPDNLGTFAVEQFHPDLEERFPLAVLEKSEKVHRLLPAAEVAGYDNVFCHIFILYLLFLRDKLCRDCP